MYAANSLRVNDFVLMPAGFPLVGNLVENKGYEVISLEMSEFQKMDGGLSCLSLRF
jgi:dimethylargininase